ncbi:MAG: phosphoribosylglycinamide formyltransferase [Sandaracinaceae bacterium]
MPEPLRVVVLVSGTGTNLRALAEATDGGWCEAEIVAVLADRRGAGALAWAQERGLPTGAVRPRDYPDRPSWDAALADAIGEHDPGLVVSAGFMRLVGGAVLARFGGRVINVHPSLLPAFPGLDAAGQAVRAGVRVAGCTVHLVDAGVDTGPILAQAAVPVRPDDDGPSLHARIQREEHRLLPRVVHWIATGALALGPPPRVLGPLAFDGRALRVPTAAEPASEADC